MSFLQCPDLLPLCWGPLCFLASDLSTPVLHASRVCASEPLQMVFPVPHVPFHPLSASKCLLTLLTPESPPTQRHLPNPLNSTVSSHGRGGGRSQSLLVPISLLFSVSPWRCTVGSISSVPQMETPGLGKVVALAPRPCEEQQGSVCHRSLLPVPRACLSASPTAWAHWVLTGPSQRGTPGGRSFPGPWHMAGGPRGGHWLGKAGHSSHLLPLLPNAPTSESWQPTSRPSPLQLGLPSSVVQTPPPWVWSTM